MAVKKLATFVHVADDNGEAHVFGPDDTVPAWAQKKITNPGAWEADDEAAGTGDPGNSGPQSGK